MTETMHDAGPAKPVRPVSGRIVCVAENRPWCEPGVRLLIASPARHSPDLPIHLFFPHPSAVFEEFLQGYPAVALNRHPLHGEWRSYDIKPIVLRTLLGAGHDEVIWIDSDIIVTRDIRPCSMNCPRH